MIPLRIVEKDHDDFDEPIVELWRDSDFIGYVFWDEDVAVVQFYSGDDGEPFDLDLTDTLRVLDIAAQIVMPHELGEDPELATLSQRIADATGTSDDWDDEDHRIVELSQEFDSLAAHRDLDGEGFFFRPEAQALIARCEGLGLAVIEMEGLDWDGDKLTPRPDLHVVIESTPGVEWGVLRAQANAAVAARLAVWPQRDSLVISFVVQLPDGSTRVL